MTHFFRYTEDLINKHYNQCASSDQLFLALCHTETEVVKLSIGGRDIALNPGYLDKIQNQMILPNQFFEWLKKPCGFTIIMETRRKEIAVENMDAVAMIAN